LQSYSNRKEELILSFLNFLKELDEDQYLEIMEALSIDLSAYKLSYVETGEYFEDYLSKNEDKYTYINVMICFAKIVSYYDRDCCINADLLEKLFNREKCSKYAKIASIIKK